jgi:prepilin-type N-terminal cleavage/methylation domain-containing protein
MLVRREDGFTLPELLVTLSIGLILSLATFSLVEFVMKRSGDVAARVNTTQRGRLAMDQITRQLRGQVCLSTTVAPMVAGDKNSATFYVDFSDQSNPDSPPEKHKLTFIPGPVGKTGTLTEAVYVGTSNHAKPPVFTYPATPTRSKVLLANVQQGGTPAAPTPVFAYYAFDTANPPKASVPLPVPLSAADLARVARIDVTFGARPIGNPKSTALVLLQGQVSVREADPNNFITDASGKVTQTVTPSCS